MALKIFGSNLFLKNKKIQFTPQIQWAALHAALEKNQDISVCPNMEPAVGLEPTTCGLRYRCSTR